MAVGETASDHFLEALRRGGVDVAFSVLGTDHPGLAESWAKHTVNGNLPPVPQLLLCLHENVAINAALGYAHFTGRAQAVVVHVDVGTLNLGAGLHNSLRNSLPVFIFAGQAPATEGGTRFGGRDQYVHWIQNGTDQPGSVRQYVKWEYEVRAGESFPVAAARGLQIAHSAPQGAVYVSAAREPLEEVLEYEVEPPVLPAAGPSVPAPNVLHEVAAALKAAKAPLLLTTAMGTTSEAVDALTEFAETFAVPVVEIRPFRMNMPADHPLHQGHVANAKIDLLREADLVLVVECPVPWVPSIEQPRKDARIVWLGGDPMAETISMRGHRGDWFLKADAAATLRELSRLGAPDKAAPALRERRQVLGAASERRRAGLAANAESGALNPGRIARLVSDIAGDDALVINESVTNDMEVVRNLWRRQPNTLMGLGGSGLGLGLSAALGAKLAYPARDVISIVGDGCYVFGTPAAVHWGARAYQAPFLTIVLNNHGWRAVARSTASLHPTGYAAGAGFPEARFEQSLDFARIVEAAGGKGFTCRTYEEAASAITQGLALVRAGTSVVIDAIIAQ